MAKKDIVKITVSRYLDCPHYWVNISVNGGWGDLKRNERNRKFNTPGAADGWIDDMIKNKFPKSKYKVEINNNTKGSVYGRSGG